MTFTIAITGRPNVGKSTLFNRFARKKLAIVDNTPGVTRDWREADGFLFDQPIRIIDTAGLEENFDDSIQGRMRRQTEKALERADAILFLVDGRSGLTPIDKHFASFIRKLGKPVVLAVNKCENEAAATAGISEAWSLGLGDPITISGAHGIGIEDIYQSLMPYFPEDEDDKEAEENTFGKEDLSKIDELEGREDFDFAETIEPEAGENPIKIAIAGRPNVGKSTLLNAIIEDERVMTGPEAGITRDAIAVAWEFEGRKIRLVDTAGLRRRARIDKGIEKMAAEDSLRAIRLAQVVILVIDATIGLEKQDLAIARHVIDEGRALVLAINKWDLVRNKEKVLEDIDYRLGNSLAQLRNMPIVSLSALKGKKVPALMKEVLKIYELWNARVSTGRLNRWIDGMTQANPPPLSQGRPNRIRYITQIKTRPPTFAMWISRPKDLPESYERYIINGLRKTFEIEGVPIRLLLRTSKNPYA